MNLRISLLTLLLVLFGGFSTWVLLQEGYFGIWAAGFTSPGALQILLDLVVACLVFCSWMLADARSRGINPVPWLVAIATTGSIAILIYLLNREWRKKAVLQGA